MGNSQYTRGRIALSTISLIMIVAFATWLSWRERRSLDLRFPQSPFLSKGVPGGYDASVLPKLSASAPISDAFEIEGAYDDSALKAKCDEVVWQEGLYFDCSNNSGGLGNMRSFILTCLRYAIEAGASIIMPTIRQRHEVNLAELFTAHRPFSYMFDQDFFVTALGAACPKLKIAKE